MILKQFRGLVKNRVEHQLNLSKMTINHSFKGLIAFIKCKTDVKRSQVCVYRVFYNGFERDVPSQNQGSTLSFLYE